MGSPPSLVPRNPKTTGTKTAAGMGMGIMPFPHNMRHVTKTPKKGGRTTRKRVLTMPSMMSPRRSPVRPPHVEAVLLNPRMFRQQTQNLMPRHPWLLGTRLPRLIRCRTFCIAIPARAMHRRFVSATTDVCHRMTYRSERSPPGSCHQRCDPTKCSNQSGSIRGPEVGLKIW